MSASRWWTLLAAALSLLVAAPARAQGRARPDPEAVKAQTAAALDQLNAYLSGIGFAQLEGRAATIAALETPEDAERRQTEVRRKVLELVGGLPGLHKNLSEVLIPGVLRHYDTLDLMQATWPRAVTLVNPASPMERRLRFRDLLAALEPVLETDRLLGTPGRVRLQRREWGDPVPIE